ncbi:TMEM175 family protein [Microbacterium sp. A196]|uniref:TMEM175 family protein n=1 Tax=unclassified Microbacterium TaxID=2609290 RepID=UPI003FD331F7
MTEHEQMTQSFSTERFKAFVDAVVAIAMTLLILPLMESVSEAASDKLSTADFLNEHSGQLTSFVLSFVLIANSWIGHHRQYNDVEVITRPLLWINVAWMATIVWLPVPTAMIGQMDSDPLQAVLYIGTLILTQFTTFAGRIYLLRHPTYTRADPQRIRLGAVADIASAILFGIALIIVIAFGSVGYFALFLLALTGTLARALNKLFRTRG